MASDRDIAQALRSLLTESNPNNILTTLNNVVQQLESKLGFNLSHKIDFIRNQLHLLLTPQPHLTQQQQPPPLPVHRQLQQPGPPSVEHFVLQQQNPNFYHAHVLPNFTPDYGFRPPTTQVPPSAIRTEVYAGDSATADIPAPEAPKESAQTGKRKRGGPGGLNKLCGVSPELQVIVGQPALPRTEIVKQLWAYIRKNNLQDPSNKRKIICNDELRLVFETDCTDMFKMNKLLAKHIIPLEPTKQTAENSKKLKVDAESASISTELESVPTVIVSDALANFFGTGEKEMAQAEVLSRIWKYIKEHQLEDPLNAMVIKCDTKLQELLGCESISALGIPEMLARNHLHKRS